MVVKFEKDTQIRLLGVWRRKFLCCSCWDSNLRPFHHESDALPLSYPHSLNSGQHVSLQTALMLLARQVRHRGIRTDCFNFFYNKIILIKL